jgi:hypothetical protein
VASCANCHARLPRGATFCPSCGAAVSRAVAAPLPQARAGPGPESGQSLTTGSAPYRPSSSALPPPLPLFTGEVVVAVFENSPEGQAKVVRFNGLIVIGIMAAIWAPFIVLLLLTAPFNLIDLFLPAFLVFFVALTWWNFNRVKRYRPAQIFVTDRRVIVQESGRDATAAAIGLENLGDVDINLSARAARRAGVAWVYFLPLGTTKAMVGRGRGRQAAPGVVWVPAVPTERAQQMRSLVLSRAGELQSRLGLATQLR